MLRLIHIQNDLKQITRDPIMGIMLVAPLLTIVLFKLLVIFLVPFIYNQTGFDIAPYYGYLFSFVIIINNGLLGIVTGFLMLDDRDGNILVLMSVTPLGKGGYLVNRLLISSFAAFIYTIAGYFILQIVVLPLHAVLLLGILSSAYAAILGLLLFTGASDKVKGLTFAKALNMLVLFAFADLFGLDWFSITAWFFPTYWFTEIIHSPGSFIPVLVGILVHGAWIIVLVFRYMKSDC